MVNNGYTSGFTLIELMVALALGLLITAAGLSVFLSSQRSLGLQSGMSELQQNANFGLSLLTHDLRHTNLNTVSSQRVNNFTLGSGIIFKKENLPSDLHGITNLESEFVTLQSKDNDNTTKTSDRLVIQYVPENSTVINCEGTTVTNASNKTIVQRYYLAQSPRQVTGEPTAYSLYCDAAYYETVTTGTGVAATSTIVMTGLGTHAEQIMQRIDAFKVRFGVKDPTNKDSSGNPKLSYLSPDEYITIMNARRTACATPIVEDTCSKTYLNVVSIEVGILSRSTGTIGSEGSQNTQTTFNLAGTDVTLNGADGKAALNKKYLRQAVNQVVAIRNTLGASS